MNKNRNNAVNELEEWQRHQFDPGHYTGGKVSPLLSHGKKNRKFGWLNFVTGSMTIVLGLAFFTASLGLVSYLVGIFGVILGLLQIIFGIKSLKLKLFRYK